MALVSRACTLRWGDPSLYLILGIWCIDVADEYPSAEVSSQLLTLQYHRLI